MLFLTKRNEGFGLFMLPFRTGGHLDVPACRLQGPHLGETEAGEEDVKGGGGVGRSGSSLRYAKPALGLSPSGHSLQVRARITGLAGFSLLSLTRLTRKFRLFGDAVSSRLLAYR